jgi:lipopolysaccharide transport system permease protein
VISNPRAQVAGLQLDVEFEMDTPCVIAWQIFDPSTGAFLFEGEWRESNGNRAEMRVPLPADAGPYRVQIAPVEARERFIVIEAQVSDGSAQISTPRIGTQEEFALRRFLRAIPKAFVYPPRALWSNRKLIRSMVRRDILARYRGSFGGALWTLLNPLLLMATYAYVFGAVLHTRFAGDSSGLGYVFYFLAGMLPWLALSEAVGRSPHVILEHRTFVKKLVFPLETLPANLVISGVVTEVFALAIFVAGLLLTRRPIPESVIWLPILIVPQLLLTIGLCWFLAALGVFVRDLGQVIGFALTLWFFLTPICYAEASPSPNALRILRFNPMYVLVSGYRAIFLEGHMPDLRALATLTCFALAIAILGFGWFHRLRRSFADII